MTTFNTDVPMRSRQVSGVDGVWEVVSIATWSVVTDTTDGTKWLGGPLMSSDEADLRRLVLETCDQIDLMKRLPGCRGDSWPWFATLGARDIHLLRMAAYRVNRSEHASRARFPVYRIKRGPSPVQRMGSSCRKWMTGTPIRS